MCAISFLCLWHHKGEMKLTSGKRSNQAMNCTFSFGRFLHAVYLPPLLPGLKPAERDLQPQWDDAVKRKIKLNQTVGVKLCLEGWDLNRGMSKEHMHTHGNTDTVIYHRFYFWLLESVQIKRREGRKRWRRQAAVNAQTKSGTIKEKQQEKGCFSCSHASVCTWFSKDQSDQPKISEQKH